MADHYETLGVDADASGAEIRRAYLTKARALHPDRHVDAGADRRRQAEREMQQVNEAFAVLGDAAERTSYDRKHDAGSAHTPPESDSFDEQFHAASEDGPETFHSSPPIFHLVRSLPLLIILGTLAGLFVFTAFASGDRVSDERTIPTIQVGDCVYEAGESMTWVPCDGSTTGIVQALVAEQVDCLARNGTTARKHPTNAGFACVEPAGDKERP